MQVHWYKDGQPLAMGNRFRHTADFGFISLDIAHTFPEDEGEYACQVVNSVGEAVVAANLKVQREFFCGGDGFNAKRSFGMTQVFTAGLSK